MSFKNIHGKFLAFWCVVNGVINSEPNGWGRSVGRPRLTLLGIVQGAVGSRKRALPIHSYH